MDIEVIYIKAIFMDSINKMLRGRCCHYSCKMHGVLI